MGYPTVTSFSKPVHGRLGDVHKKRVRFVKCVAVSGVEAAELSHCWIRRILKLFCHATVKRRVGKRTDRHETASNASRKVNLERIGSLFKARFYNFTSRVVWLRKRFDVFIASVRYRECKARKRAFILVVSIILGFQTSRHIVSEGGDECSLDT